MGYIGSKEVRVNTFAPNFQMGPQVFTLATGGWVITWESTGQDGSDIGVYQQAYNANGTKLGVETRVNTETDGYQGTADVSALSDGGWVVSWQSAGQDGDGIGIYHQVFNADGTKRDGEIPTNTTTAGSQDAAQVAVLKDGGWFVAWEGPDSGNYGIYVQAYNADGTADGVETLVNTEQSGNQLMPVITALTDGGVVVTWVSQGQDGSLDGVYQQAYDGDGTPRGGETLVNTYTTNDQNRPQVVALAEGAWVVVWTSWNGQDGDGHGVYQQKFNADGTKDGGEVQVNTYTTSDQGVVKAVAALADGGWVVTWMSAGQDGDLGGVYQQAFNPDGSPQGGEVQVNTYTKGPQTNIDVTGLSDGGWVVTWQSTTGQDGSDGGVYQQAYKADGTRNGGEIRVNDLTQGDQALPKITAIANGGWVVTWQSSVIDGNMTGISQKIFHTVYGNKLIGTNAAETLVGGSAGETLIGKNGADILNAGAGNDILRGGLGRDVMTGGANRDIFDFDKITESRKGASRDVITDFRHGQHDRIDLRTIDADMIHGGNQAFKFIGGQSFAQYHAKHPNVWGMVRYDHGIVQINVNRGMAADMEIKAIGASHANDFFL